MTISITNTIGMLWVECPQCKKLQSVREWGIKKCLNEECNGNEFNVEYNLATATMMLQDVEKQRAAEPKIRHPSRPQTMKVQRVLDGWIGVLQS
jgi:hypothetical protein